MIGRERPIPGGVEQRDGASGVTAFERCEHRAPGTTDSRSP